MKLTQVIIAYRGGHYFKENPTELKGLYGRDLKWFQYGFTPLIKAIEYNKEESLLRMQFCLLGEGSSRTRIHRLIPKHILSDHGEVELRYFLEIYAGNWKIDFPEDKELKLEDAEYKIKTYDGLYEFHIPVH